jgi:multidrug efflux pump subunit AcrB
MFVDGQTLNTMTLGGFALAVGILVDNSTVVIENIERHVKEGEPLRQAIVAGCGEVAVPTALSTLCICIVFVPVFMLQGTAKYLFSPLSLSVCVSLIASLALSFTLVPVLFVYLMRSSLEGHAGHPPHDVAPRSRFNVFSLIHHKFEDGFNGLRDGYRDVVAFCVGRAVVTSIFFLLLMGFSLLLFPHLGRDFFPQVDAGQMRLHVRAPPASRLEETQRYFAEVENAIRQIVGQDQIEVILDNIGLPYSGINIALSDSATVGPMDGEILISLKEKHTPTAAHVADISISVSRRPSISGFPGRRASTPTRLRRRLRISWTPSPASSTRMCFKFPTLPP